MNAGTIIGILITVGTAIKDVMDDDNNCKC